MTGNDQDDWEVALDTGEFDKRLEQLGKDRTTTQESILSSNRNVSNSNAVQSNKAIRILKRPTHQSQNSTSNDSISSNVMTATNNTNSNSPTPVTSIILRNQSKESIANTSSTQSSKAPIKTYEQREHEYRLARLRIMGEEESSSKDDDTNPSTLDSLQSSPKTSNSSSNINSTESSSQQ